jgi:F-type H+-transporting ATPase subunit b
MLSIDFTAIIVFVLIWILVLILSRVFFKPVRRVMDARESGTRGNREAARSAAEATEAGLRRIEEDLKAARAEADGVRDALETEALKEKARLIADLHAETRKQIDAARREMDDRIVLLKKELEGEAERLAGEIEKKVLD